MVIIFHHNDWVGFSWMEAVVDVEVSWMVVEVVVVVVVGVEKFFACLVVAVKRPNELDCWKHWRLVKLLGWEVVDVGVVVNVVIVAAVDLIGPVVVVVALWAVVVGWVVVAAVEIVVADWIAESF